MDVERIYYTGFASRDMGCSIISNLGERGLEAERGQTLECGYLSHWVSVS